jgi:hypothetical protein
VIDFADGRILPFTHVTAVSVGEWHTLALWHRR